MSAPSGIKVPQSLTATFGSAQSNPDDVRALVFVIEGESFNHLTTVKPKGSYDADIELLPGTLPSPKTPASFAYRLDSKEMGKYEWMMITFVPDDAGVRAKMLQASSRAGLMKALGASNFKHDWFATSINDLSRGALLGHMKHLQSPAPLSASEAALAEVRDAEAAEAKRAALDPENEKRRRAAVTGLSGKMAWGDGVQDALAKAAQRSDDGWIVVLEIPASSPGSLSLVTSEACKPSELASKLPAKSPCFTFYSHPTPPPPTPAPAPKPAASAAAPAAARDMFQATVGGARPVIASNAPRMDAEPQGEEKPKEEGETAGSVEGLSLKDGADADVKSPTEDAPADKVLTEEPKASSPVASQPAQPAQDVKGRVIFIYSCPGSSPVKLRMVYSTSVRGVQQDATDRAGCQIVGKLETSDISDLTESYLKSALPSGFKPTHSTSLPTPGKSAGGGASFGSPAGASFGRPAMFGAPAPATGANFGRPRPIQTNRSGSAASTVSASQVPLPASGPATPAPATPTGGANEEDGGDDSKERIKSAFDAFGPRVGAGGGGGFARPRPAGRR